MAATVLSSLILSKNRRIIIELFSPRLREVWNKWELRALVVISLSLQILLIILGNRRKCVRKVWITIVVWLAYVAADSVATTALGVLSSDLRDVVKNGGPLSADTEMTAFWAPFLLLHLGGPDTITAFSLEDNELWLRHLLQLVVQTSVAFYIILMAWTGSHVSFLSILMITAGMIKYGERTWFLWSASYDQAAAQVAGLRDSLIRDEDILVAANGLFHQVTKRVFVNAPLSHTALENALYTVLNSSSKIAFGVIEKELGFMYDFFYTKAMGFHTRWGIILRCISFLCTCIVFVLFLVLHHHWQKYSKIDLSITFLLIAAAILLDIYAALVLFSSDHTVVWLRKHNISSSITTLQSIISGSALFRNCTWSNSMGQFNLLSYFLKEKPPTLHQRILQLIPKIDIENLEKQKYAAYCEVSDEVKQWILESLKKIHLETKVPFDDLSGFLWGTYFGYQNILGLENLREYAITLEFAQRVLVWHIITELCHYNNQSKKDCPGTDKHTLSNCRMSKKISRYMMYLVIMSSNVLPPASPFGQMSIQDTCTEAIEAFFKSFGPDQNQEAKREKKVRIEACKSLICKYSNSNQPGVSKRLDRSELFRYACELASKLQNIERIEKRWEVIAKVWVTILVDAVSECGGKQHARELTQGGELLTHVWILMSHFGFTHHVNHLKDVVRSSNGITSGTPHSEMSSGTDNC